MKVLIVSDTHGHNDKMWDVIEKEKPFDMMIHCGDIEMDPQIVRDRIDSAFLCVAGNNDYYYDLEQIKVFNIGKHTALLVHGHRQHVYSDISNLYYLALENHADLVFFGHIHVPVIRKEGEVTFLNPGSLTYPRQQGRESTYMIMTLDPGKVPEFEIKKI